MPRPYTCQNEAKSLFIPEDCSFGYWAVPVDKLGDVQSPDRDHAYILPDNTVWVLNHDGHALIQMNGGGIVPAGGVDSFNGRMGTVTPMAGDYTAAMVGADPAGSAGAVRAELGRHVDDKNNPHEVTYSETGAAAASHNHNASQITAGTLPIARGGTGATTAAAALNALGAAAASHTHTVAQVTGTLPVNKGGTGATTILNARKNLEITIGTWRPVCTVFSGSLPTGQYWRNGQQVFISVEIYGTVNSLNAIQISGLPYASTGSNNVDTISVIAHGAAFKDDVTIWGETTSSSITLYKKLTGGFTYFTPNATGAGTIRLFGYYTPSA